MLFNQLNLPVFLITALNNRELTKAYPIQEKVIPAVLNKKDVLGIAKTGSGKTASYVLPIIANIYKLPASKNRHIKVLVLVPTRELASQVQEEFQFFGADHPISCKSLAVYGGVSVNTQMIALQGVEVLIATTGRLLELTNANAINLSEVQTLVLDEADKMLNLGFKDEIAKIFSLLPQKRQNLLFSATLNSNLDSLETVLLNKPEIVKITEENNIIDSINLLGYFVEDDKKGPLLRHLIKSQNLNQVLVFASSIQRVDNIANKLRANGIEAWSIHSKKSQGKRTDLLTKFKHGKLRVLVATDLISRGIDIEFLPCVINYELPRSPKDFIHRIGRTGRAESPGDAIAFVSQADKHHFKIIQKKIKKIVTMIDSEKLDLTVS